MGEPRLYLDHNATAPLLPQARDALVSALGAANPSSVHGEGRRARAIVESARRDIAGLVAADPDTLTFTSGASEAAATVLSPDWLVDGNPRRLARLAVVDTDHACVREAGSFAEETVTRLPVDAHGIVDTLALAAWAADLGPEETGLLVLTHANSETGVLQPLAEIGKAIAQADVLLAVDAAQSAGRVPLDLPAIGADVIFFSGHKAGAAKGVGAMALRRGATRPMPMIRGGGQEGGRRAGTLPVALVASFGAAARIAAERLADRDGDLAARRGFLEDRLRRSVDGATILGLSSPRLPQTVSVSVRGVVAETAQMALDLAGIAVSAGSACSSGKIGRSHVVDAMVRGGLAIDPSEGAVRVSFGYETSKDDLDRFATCFAAVCSRLRDGENRNRAA